MSKNGLRMVVSQNFDMTHLSAPSRSVKIFVKVSKCFSCLEILEE